MEVAGNVKTAQFPDKIDLNNSDYDGCRKPG
jgi:hypothetical protein